MFDSATLTVFVIAALALLLSPGPAVLYIVARSVQQGRKAALFFFAFLPQFVDPSRGSVTRQFLILGMIFIVLGLLTDSLYAIVAGSLSRLMRSSVGLLRAQRWVTGSIYIGLGLVTALSGNRSE